MTLRGFSHLPATKKIFTNTNIYHIKTIITSKNRKCNYCKMLIEKGSECQKIRGTHYGQTREWYMCNKHSIPDEVINEIKNRKQ